MQGKELTISSKAESVESTFSSIATRGNWYVQRS